MLRLLPGARRWADVRAAATNNTFTGAFRGLGSLQVKFTVESMMDEAAEAKDFCSGVVNCQIDSSILMEIAIHENRQGAQSAMILALAAELEIHGSVSTMRNRPPARCLRGGHCHLPGNHDGVNIGINLLLSTGMELQRQSLKEVNDSLFRPVLHPV